MIAKKSYLMRMICSLFIISASMGTVACGEDDDPPSTNNLIGTWQVDNVRLTGRIAGIEVDENVNPSGTITFNSDFTGKENYSYTIPNLNIPIVERDDFTWTSNGNQLVIDPGDVDQQDWTRTINEAKSQVGSYQIVDGTTNYTVTIMLSK